MVRVTTCPQWKTRDWCEVFDQLLAVLPWQPPPLLIKTERHQNVLFLFGLCLTSVTYELWSHLHIFFTKTPDAAAKMSDAFVEPVISADSDQVQKQMDYGGLAACLGSWLVVTSALVSAWKSVNSWWVQRKVFPCCVVIYSRCSHFRLKASLLPC